MHNKPLRPGREPRRTRRVGADAAFARAMARSEFGRFYVDEAQQAEVRRSLTRGKTRRKPADDPAPEPVEAKKSSAKRAKCDSGKPGPWRQPRVRERRTELADARARLAAAAKSRKEEAR